MKTLLLTGFACLVLLLSCAAQKKVPRYCMVSMAPTVRLGSWKNAAFFSFKDTSVIADLYKVENLDLDTDVLNYMSSIGWTLAGEMVTGRWVDSKIYIFRREFDQSELSIPAQ